MGDDTLYFQIGFRRCGTTAIAVFFNRSGIPCVHHDRGRLALRMRDNLAAGRAPIAGCERYRAFSRIARDIQRELAELRANRTPPVEKRED